MNFQFTTDGLDIGRYEPEGIYLSSPFAEQGVIVQGWGENATFYQQFHYNGVQLLGHNGIDFFIDDNTQLLAVDTGRVMEVSYEFDGFERYIKLEHTWGESFYAHIGEILIEAGQIVQRYTPISLMDFSLTETPHPHFHFGIRVYPYNRFDGWGGFCNPIPYLNLENIRFADEYIHTENAIISTTQLINSFEPSPMVTEKAGIRRP